MFIEDAHISSYKDSSSYNDTTFFFTLYYIMISLLSTIKDILNDALNFLDKNINIFIYPNIMDINSV